MQEADKIRKEDARRREEHWMLLRLCVKELKEGEHKWSTRKIEECDRIKEEAKEDRLAIARDNKKLYGIKGLSKEENKRLKKRTEDKIELAQTKSNYWKCYTGEGRGKRERQGEDESKWMKLKTEVLALEKEAATLQEDARGAVTGYEMSGAGTMDESNARGQQEDRCKEILGGKTS